MVTVLYSTGDSFGRAKNGSYEDIWLFKNPKVAMDFKRHIMSIAKKAGFDYSPSHKDYNYTNEEEKFVYVQEYIPWNGYFERFEDCILTMVMVEPNYEDL